MPTGRRLQIADYEQLAEAKDLDWLERELPPLCSTLTTWRCRQCGHVFDNSYQSVLHGAHPCPQCRKVWRCHSPDAYRSLAESRGFEWVGQTLPARHNSRTEWRCRHGHVWSATYRAIEAGRACHHCAGMARKTEDDYRAFATRGIFWIGKDLPENTHTPTDWRCENGHEWTTRYATIYLGSKCPHCKHKKRRRLKNRHLETDYHHLAEQRGFSWLGDILPSNSHKPTLWQCTAGHQWETSFVQIDQGGGCPYCSGVARKSKIDYQALAEKKNIVWIGEQLPKNTSTPTAWRCDNGHEFEASYRHIEPKMIACPTCPQARPCSIADYQSLAEKQNIEWLDNHIPEKTTELTTWRCSKGHEFQASYERLRRRANACLKCRGRSAADYEALARPLGWRWVGGHIPRNTHIVTNWRCSQGHTLRMTYSWVARKGVCPFCSGRRRSLASQKTK